MLNGFVVGTSSFCTIINIPYAPQSPTSVREEFGFLRSKFSYLFTVSVDEHSFTIIVWNKARTWFLIVGYFFGRDFIGLACGLLYAPLESVRQSLMGC